MAEVSNLCRFHQQALSSPAIIISGRAVTFQQQEEEEEEEDEPLPNVYSSDFDSLSSHNSSFLINDSFNFTSTTDLQSGSQESESVHSDQNFSYYGPEDEDDDQMNFVTDLFATRRGISDHESDNSEFGCRCTHEEEPELVLGLEPECDRIAAIPSTGGLRIVDMESESDSEAVEVDSRVDSVNNHDGLDPNDDDLGQPGFWDCLQFDSHRVRASFDEEFEWEEVNVRENLSSLIDRIEEISVSSDGESSRFNSGGEEDDEENARNVEWQVLLTTVNNPELAIGFDEYNVPFGELVEAESSIKGSPPAAKFVVENLPSVVLTMEDLTANNVVCAVCKDEIPLGLEVTRLPCCHHYHEDCIVPWLSIRNTCPLCRYELPTDDVDYERRKNGDGGGTGRIDDLQVRYNYQLLP